MQLYNTLTHKVEDLTPLDAASWRMYSCGPTVYDHIHIGNLSAFIMADTLRRALSLKGRPVKHVMNLTDVDDKTIRRSHERYPDLEAMAALKQLTDEYGQIFFEDMKAVGNELDPVHFVRATDNIGEMQDLIRKLHASGFAYTADDGIYFSIKAYTDSGKVYGQLSPVSASSTATSRIQNDEYDKESAHDFALWKTQKPGEPAWDFELDGRNYRGRPGWHIECSVMSTRNLGQPFDIHTGGVDLIFPHHENEIAQSTAGKPDALYARYFAHNEHILVDGKKMSKSLGNFYTLKDIIAKGYEPLAFRLLVLQSHYRSQAHFSYENLEAAQNRLRTFRAFADLVWNSAAKGAPSVGTAALSLDEAEGYFLDDLNTPAALASAQAQAEALYDLAVQYGGLAPQDMDAFKAMLAKLDAMFGLQLSSRPDIATEQKSLIAEREAARAAKDWTRSDALRDELQTQGIGLRDTAAGSIWYRS